MRNKIEAKHKNECNENNKLTEIKEIGTLAVPRNRKTIMHFADSDLEGEFSLFGSNE